MHMLYNSDSFVVVAFESLDAASVQAGQPALSRGGYEIVDKFSRKDIFIEGALAERFQQGAQALVDKSASEEEMDEFIGGYTGMAQHALMVH